MYAEVVLPESATAAGFGLHPALLDAALHAVSLGDFVAPGEVRLPFAWTGINLHAIGAAALRVRIAAAGTDAVTVDVADSTGAPVASIDSLTLLPVSRAQVATGPALQDSLFHTQWTAVAVKASVTQPAAVVLGDAEFADRLGVTAVETVGDAVGVVILPVTDADAGVAGADVRVRAGVHRVLSLVQEWLAQVRPAGDRLVVLTRGAVAVDGPVTDLVGAAVWGLLRSAQSENPDRIVLLDTDGSDTSLAVLLDTIGLDEPQLAVRNGAVSALRLVRALPATTLLTPQDDAVPHRVEVVGGGTLHSVGFVPAEEAAAPLAAGQVRVAVRAAGINFRDVAIALGMVPDQQVIGSEAAGVVVEVGPGVTDLTVGDRVFGLFSGAFGPLAVTDRRVVAPMPQGWTFPQAASVPVVFLTAYYALRDLTSVQPGERLLSTPQPAASAWPRCNWPGTGVSRCTAPRHRRSGTHYAASAWTTRTSPHRGTWTSKRRSGPLRRVGVWTWSSTPSLGSTSTRRCGSSALAAGSPRWARPTNATPPWSRPRTTVCRIARSTWLRRGWIGSGRC
ncbi:hypothetical protein GCM10027610_000020 [Dactylosporangium cerinum]